MKEEWLMSGAVVPVDVETTAALVAEIKRLIDVVGGMALAQLAQEPVDNDFFKSLANSPDQRPWVGLTDEEVREIHNASIGNNVGVVTGMVEAKLKEKNT